MLSSWHRARVALRCGGSRCEGLRRWRLKGPNTYLDRSIFRDNKAHCAVVGLSLLAIAVTLVTYGAGLLPLTYLNPLLVLGSFLAVLGLGQGAVVISGGLDLSIPWTVAFSGILLTGMTSSHPAFAAWGDSDRPRCRRVDRNTERARGCGSRLPAFVMALAMNGILQTAALVYSNGTPVGFTPRWLQWFMSGKFWGLAPAAWSLLLFALFTTLLLSRSTFGRRARWTNIHRYVPVKLDLLCSVAAATADLGQSAMAAATLPDA